MAASTSFSSLTVNTMVDKAERNNPSELRAIKTLCVKMRPNLLLYKCWCSGIAQTWKSPSTLTRLFSSLCLSLSFGFSFSPSKTAHPVTPKHSDENSHYKFRNLSHTFPWWNPCCTSSHTEVSSQKTKVCFSLLYLWPIKWCGCIKLLHYSVMITRGEKNRNNKLLK